MNAVNNETIRSFIAIDLPADLKKEIASIQLRFKPLFGRARVSWVRAENMHLTIKFLGNVSAADIPAIVAACQPVGLQSGFNLYLNRIGFFPGVHNPKVMWCGYDHSDELTEAHRKIESALVPIGFPAEEKSFVAHLTLARFKEISSKPSSPFYVDLKTVRLETEKLSFSFRHTVTDIRLVKSRLLPKGSEYTVMHRWPLKPLLS